MRIDKESHAPSTERQTYRDYQVQRRASQRLHVQSGCGSLTCPYGIVELPAFRPHLSCPLWSIRQNVERPSLRHAQDMAGKTVRQADGGTELRSWKKQRLRCSVGDRAGNRVRLQKAENRFSCPNGVPTSSGCFIARESEESSKGRTQMTVPRTGALPDKAAKWKAIDWQEARQYVRRLQMRIAKAVKERSGGKVKALQWLLTHSFYAKLLAVKRVTSNKGKNTPGVDGILWKGSKAKIQAANTLQRHGYKAQALRRIYIPKKNGKKRPLSIPTMYDRAMQALYKLALAPIAETTADPNSYGFREGRRCADAITAAFNALSKPNSATHILEGDIRGCFDNISKEWMLENIPMDKAVLRSWLEAGYVENGITYPTHKGTPQGGVMAPPTQ